jgi:putative peptide zinc metalloprotease protein
MVLVPSSGSGHGAASSAPGQDEQPWVFPFDKPLPPAQGDNQAAAYNTKDGSTKYDVAFALVWATGDEVLNVNEAHAYASCSNCVTVAVAFQVVLIMDDAHVVVPQNLAVSANYQCYRCITAALASQLVLSVEKTPGEIELRALGDVWARLTAFGQQITAYSLTEIASQLKQFQTEITTILGKARPVSTTATATPAPGAGQESSAPPASPGSAPGTESSSESSTESSTGTDSSAPSTESSTESSTGTDSSAPSTPTTTTAPAPAPTPQPAPATEPAGAPQAPSSSP